MADDDELAMSLAPQRSFEASNDEHGAEDEEGEDRAPDFFRFMAEQNLGGRAGGKQKKSEKNEQAKQGRKMRRGAKDFQSHGTQTQAEKLEQSRAAMESFIGAEPVYQKGKWSRGWLFPDWWSSEEGRAAFDGIRNRPEKDLIDIRNRVVLLEHSGAFQERLMGRWVPGLKETQVGCGRNWLLPEEALFMVERGSLDLWWPHRGIAELFPPKTRSENGMLVAPPEEECIRPSFEDDSYEVGVPMSLQMAYALLIGTDDEQGKVSLQKYQVYTNLKRGGFHVVRASMMPPPPVPTRAANDDDPTSAALIPAASSRGGSLSLWQWLATLFPSMAPAPLPYGPLVRPGIYRSYNDIYKQLQLIPSPVHGPDPAAPDQDHPAPPSEKEGKEEEGNEAVVNNPYQLHYYVWAAEGRFSKSNPGPPEARICVVDAHETRYPTRTQSNALLAQCPYDPPPPPPTQPPSTSIGLVHKRFKQGCRKAVVAIVDHGIISYMEFTQTSLESLVDRFDNPFGFGRGQKMTGRGGRGRPNTNNNQRPQKK